MLPRRDLDDILDRHADDFRAFAGARIFITGATGFVGTWLLESLLHADDALKLGASVVLLTRDAEAFRRDACHSAQHPAVRVVAGDVRSLVPSAIGTVDAIVHAATPASLDLSLASPLAMLDTIVDGGRAVLELARESGRIPVLFTSSGAVYGPQPPDLERLDETFRGAPDPLAARNVYHEGKRVAELQCAIYAEHSGIRPKIARLFAFAGPRLPLDRHFAIGNFIGDALAARKIHVSAAGSTIRSYLYAAEMAGWLWRIFARGEAGRAYNVGSEDAYDVREVAACVAAVTGGPEPVTRVPDATVNRYVPATGRAREELGLRAEIGLREAIRRTVDWHLEIRQSQAAR